MLHKRDLLKTQPRQKVLEIISRLQIPPVTFVADELSALHPISLRQWSSLPSHFEIVFAEPTKSRKTRTCLPQA
jgi:hypothetical protein